MMLRRASSAGARWSRRLPPSAREPPYLTAQDLDLVSILPPPVAPARPDREQLAVVLRAQRCGHARAHRAGQARRRRIGRHDVRRRAGQGARRPPALPATTRLFVRLRRPGMPCSARPRRPSSACVLTSATRRSRRWCGRRSAAPIRRATPRTSPPRPSSWATSCPRNAMRSGSAPTTTPGAASSAACTIPTISTAASSPAPRSRWRCRAAPSSRPTSRRAAASCRQYLGDSAP